MACTIFETYEKPQAAAPYGDNPRRENPAQSNAYKTNAKKSNTDSFNHLSISDEADEMSRADFENEIKSNIDYDIIVENKQNDKRQTDEIITLMLDATCSPSLTVHKRRGCPKIGGSRAVFAA